MKEKIKCKILNKIARDLKKNSYRDRGTAHDKTKENHITNTEQAKIAIISTTYFVVV